MQKKENNITWIQFNNIFPLIVSAVMVASSFFALSSQVALLNQKVDFLVENMKTFNTEIAEIKQEHKTFETRMTTLEVMHR